MDKMFRLIHLTRAYVKPVVGSSNNSNNMIWFVRYGILTALRTALGHDYRPSAARRADNHDLGPFCGPLKFHNALTNHVIVIILTSV